MAEPLKLNIKKPLKLAVKGDEMKEGIPAGTITSSAGGITIIFKNAKIHAEKVIIKRTK